MGWRSREVCVREVDGTLNRTSLRVKWALCVGCCDEAISSKGVVTLERDCFVPRSDDRKVANV